MMTITRGGARMDATQVASVAISSGCDRGHSAALGTPRACFAESSTREQIEKDVNPSQARVCTAVATEDGGSPGEPVLVGE
ncbi:MAG: hypothetical protein GY842_15540 [bacterium]|nr:hypothetical protein [bacterium]